MKNKISIGMKVKIIWLCAFYRARMLLVPSKYLEKYWGEKGRESPEEETEQHYWTAMYIGNAVGRIAEKTPWESKCMVQALTAQYLLRKKGISSTMYLGVGKDEEGNMIAHAWIRSGRCYVTGGDGRGMAVVGKFRK